MGRDRGQLARQARMVLDFNWTGSYTQPSPRLYPHQWSWDSAFIALGYAHYDTERAASELTSLFRGQWANGLLPHIVFNPEIEGYFPGSGFWRTGGSPHAPGEVGTSGVVQPPVHATAALRLYRSMDPARGQEFLENLFPRLVAWHEYLHRERDPDGGGLVYIRHPWESGMDNAPTWDPIMQRIRIRPGAVPGYQRRDMQFVSAADRPKDAEYDRFTYLIDLFAGHGYDEARIREECPFLVEDVLFNSLLCGADRDLAEVSRLLGRDGSLHERRSEEAARAMNARLWDEEHGVYLGFDRVTGGTVRVYDAIGGFLPLFAGIPDGERAQRLVENLAAGGFCLQDNGCYPVASYDRHGFGFSPVRYWRGPVWVNVNWMLMHGLERYGYPEHAARLRQTVLDLVRGAGFYEYFDPTSGRGHGSDFFSWTAALLLDILHESPEEDGSRGR